MNRLNVNQMKQVGAFILLYFLAIGLGVILSNLVDHQGNMFYAPAFSALIGGLPLLPGKNQSHWRCLSSWLRDRILFPLLTSWCRSLCSSLDSREFCGDGRIKWSFSLGFAKCLVFSYFRLCDDRAHPDDVVLSDKLPHVFIGPWKIDRLCQSGDGIT